MNPDLALPGHIAIIMDGNGRWAAKRGLPRQEGHRAGASAVRAIVEECRRLGIGYLTLYAFSSENWSRSPAEIAALFSLLLSFLATETPVLEREGICLRVLGEVEALPPPQRAALALAMSRTAKCRDMVLNLALNYGARAEIIRACRRLAGRPESEITEAAFGQELFTAGQPDPDLLIRTSGELRLSNFLLYQCAYSELYFTDKLWPDFDTAELHAALAAYSRRDRRFGGLKL
ncbi:MAG: di-trans,poly-cis-decaprenylcistransferase [Desulfovibrio sp.]|nr:di-trans,poly-cis-decaprenylcistransferase [Desulfovibrio sp.]